MRFVLLTAALLFNVAIHSQTPIPEYGIFTETEVALKECPFEKSAKAVVIFDQGYSYHNDEYNLITERRIRIKILKESGIEEANIRIPVYSHENFETLNDVDAVTLTFNDKGERVITELKPRNVYTRKINRYYSEVTFAVPAVKTGSIIEYKYISRMKNYGGLRDWVFQKHLPVMLSSYKLIILPNAEFAYSVYKKTFLPIKIQPDNTAGSILYEMKDIPSLGNEPFMNARHDYLQRVVFQLSGFRNQKINTSWKDLSAGLLSDADFGRQIERKVDYKSDLMPFIMKQTSKLEQLQTVYNYVRSNVTWDNIYSKFSTDGLKSVWQKKKGSSGDINLLLINILKDLDFDVSPLLVSERDHGRIDTTYPFLDQFNKVVAYVKLNDNTYVLDATDGRTPFDMIPFDLLNTKAFIVDKKNSQFVTLTKADKPFKTVTNMIVSVDKSAINGRLLESTYDYGYLSAKGQFLSGKKQYIDRILNGNSNVIIDSFKTEEVDSLSTFNHEFTFKASADKSGNYLIVPLNLFNAAVKNPFTAEMRFSDIDFGCRYLQMQRIQLQTSKDLDVESLPKPTKITMPDDWISFTRNIQKLSNGELVIELVLSINQSKIDSYYYAHVKEFYKKMTDLLNEPILLKEKL